MTVAQSLENVVARAKSLEAIRRQDLHCGDCLLVTTQNSVYTVWPLFDGYFWVWGGWFDRLGRSPHKVTINGCTWGGCVIKQDVLAAVGLQLEFGNNVRTTRIRRIQVMRGQAGPSLN